MDHGLVIQGLVILLINDRPDQQQNSLTDETLIVETSVLGI